MNKYAVTFSIKSYAVGFVHPSTFQVQIVGLQYNLQNTTLSTSIGTQISSFDYVNLTQLNNDMISFQVTDSTGTYMQQLDMMALIATRSPFQVGSYLFSQNINQYPGTYTVLSSYAITFVFSKFSTSITNPLFSIYFTDSAGKSYTGWTHRFNQSQFDLGINGLSYSSAMLMLQFYTFGTFQFQTDFGTSGAIDSPAQPMNILVSITTTSGQVYTASNSQQVLMYNQVSNIKSPTNISYQTYNLSGVGTNSSFTYSILVKNTSFVSAIVPTPIPVPINKIIAPVTYDYSIDQQLGISEESLFMEINEGNMSPSTRNAAKQRLYQEELIKQYDKKGLQQEEEKRQLVPTHPVNQTSFESIYNYEQLERYEELRQQQQYIKSTTNPKQVVIPQLPINMTQSQYNSIMKQKDLIETPIQKDHQGSEVVIKPNQEWYRGGRNTAQIPNDMGEKNSTATTEAPVVEDSLYHKWSTIGAIGSAVLAGGLIVKQGMDYLYKKTDPVNDTPDTTKDKPNTTKDTPNDPHDERDSAINNDLAQINELINTTSEKNYQKDYQIQKRDNQHYDEAKQRGGHANFKRKKLYHPSQL